MSTRKRREESKKRKHRSRPTPRWLQKRQDLDPMAQRRCLMVLSVLSGERPVTDVIEEAKISRGLYYQLEERALCAMLEALAPGAGPGRPPDVSGKIAELEAKVEELTRQKRRAERLLLLTRKVVRPGPVTTGAGRPPGRRRSEPGGRIASPSSSATTPSSSTSSPSTPTPAGEDGP